MKLSLIFPAYNEAATIVGVLEDFSRYCSIRQQNVELIVVNDGSHDATAERVETYAKTKSSIRLITLKTNQGYGRALRAGFAAATGDYLFFTDSDGQFMAADLDLTLAQLDKKTIVLGYRQPRSEGAIRRINAWAWAIIIRVTLGVHVRDLNCAWKLFPRSLVRQTILRSDGAFISAELLYQAKKAGLLFREIPVHHFQRIAGVSTGARPHVIWQAMQELGTFMGNRR